MTKTSNQMKIRFCKFYLDSFWTGNWYQKYFKNIYSSTPSLFSNSEHTTLQHTAMTIRVTNIAVSDQLLVASLSDGTLFYIPTLRVLQESLLSSTKPAIIDWETKASVIRNKELIWKSMESSGNKIVFGLQGRLGNIKIYQWL